MSHNSLSYDKTPYTESRGIGTLETSMRGDRNRFSRGCERAAIADTNAQGICYTKNAGVECKISL